MKQWINPVLKYPRSVIALSILLTIILGSNIPKLRLDPDVKAMLPPDFDLIVSMDQMDELFGGSELVIMALTGDDIFSQPTLEKIAKMTSEIEAFPFVEKVVSLTNAADVIGSEDGFEVSEIIEEFPQGQAEVEQIKQRLQRNELLYGNIVSRDFTSTALIVMLANSDKSNSDEEIYQALTALKRRYEHPEIIHLAGYSLTRQALSVVMQRDILILFPYGVVLMIFFLVFSFRSWIGAFLPFVILILIAVNTLGLMGLLGLKFTIIGLVIPVMLIAVTSSYSIHIISHYFEEYAIESGSRSKDEIIRSSLGLLITPVFLSALTTLIGFLSLQSHVLPPIRELALLVSFGIVVAFILSLTFLPAALKILPFSVHLQEGRSSRRFNVFLDRWGRFFVHHKTIFLVILVGAVLLIGTGIPRIRVDTNPVCFWNKQSEIRQSNDFIDQYFGGSSQLSIWAKGDIKSPEFLQKMELLSEYLKSKPQVTQVVSIVDQLKLMNQAFHGDSVEYDCIPETREQVAQYLFLYTLSGDPEDLDQFVDYDYEQAQIQARVIEMGSTASYQLYRDCKEFISQNLSREEFPEVTGLTALIGVLAKMVVNGQIRSLIVSIILVCLVTALIFRSLMAGLLSILPLTGAILIIFGLMGYLQINLDMATVMLSSILIGVGVDYMIHFLFRYRLEVRSGHSWTSAVPRTLRTSGKGILYNGISVVIGFCVLLFSGFLPIYFFGFLIVFSIIACLLGALTVLPSILMITKPKFISMKDGSANE